MSEETERVGDKELCQCGCDQFRVYISVVIDDARLYCVKCGEEHTP